MLTAEFHNNLVSRVVAEIVGQPIKSGGEIVDALVMLESIVAGVIWCAIKEGGDEAALQSLVEGARIQLKAYRLLETKPEGAG